MATIGQQEKFRIEGDPNAYLRTATGLFKFAPGELEKDIKRGFDPSKLKTIQSSEVEQLFKDIIDEGSKRYNVEKLGGFKNETGFGPGVLQAGDVKGYLGRQALGTLPTRQQELAGNVQGLTSGSALSKAQPAPQASQFPAAGQTVGDLFTHPQTGQTFNWKTGQLINDPNKANQPTAEAQPAQPSLNIASNLSPGSTGQDVKTLQDYLVANGYMTQEEVNTGYGTYGTKTTAAVAKLQKDLGVDTAGYAGYFGPLTKKALGSQNTGGQTGVVNVQEPTTTSNTQNLMNPPKTAADIQSALNQNQSYAQQAIAAMTPTQQEQDLTTQLKNMRAQFEVDLAKNNQQTIPTSFLTGQANEATRLEAAKEGQLTAQIANLQQQRGYILQTAQALDANQKNQFATMLELLQGVDPNTLTPAMQKQVSDLAVARGIPPALVFAGMQTTFTEQELDNAYKQAQIDDKNAPTTESTPTSYREWELAGKPGTYANWLAEQSVKAPTSAQQTVATYATRLEQANPIIDSLENYMVKLSPISFESQRLLPSYLQSNEYKQFDQASRNFINAVLRRESGAVISPSEFDNAYKQYLPRPSDDAKTLANKKANREVVYQSFKKSAGSAYESVGDLLGDSDPLGLRN